MSETIATETLGRWTKAERSELKARPFDRAVLRALVDFRLGAQGKRKAAGNQIGAIERATDTCADPIMLHVLHEDMKLVEGKVDVAIKAMVEAHEAGRWAVSIPGIAHTFAAVLLAYVDLHPWMCLRPNHKVPCKPADPCTADCHRGYVNTAGKLWRFAGVDGDAKMRWLSQAKLGRRPWCALLKTTTWQIGESFKKLGADSTCLYARLYRQRKAQEIERNESGANREDALRRLEVAKAKRWAISPEMKAAWAAGKLQPVGLDYRAGRYAAKMFLSHFHHVLHEVEEGGPPPVPFAIGVLGHADFIPPPNWPLE